MERRVKPGDHVFDSIVVERCLRGRKPGRLLSWPEQVAVARAVDEGRATYEALGIAGFKKDTLARARRLIEEEATCGR